ncbi:winged helix DNA-binding domain-containing protein [Nocardioides mangrovicus]|uniref:Winged helix DNA-binding domain-containing protein n=1 Tax=Nocardioides mangrovicus TaxID=2478913 RepID=A0A3L8P3J8_9ACTN|nr:winged helix DNA-binding domain-containing protein [Nocardioides mangrovicus]RLV49684.1 winged helix DNA-binding domain-containing protein [Nocardioides mangrovicus]
MRTVSDAERRARLGRRHALAAPEADAESATRAVVCLHGTEPASVYLSVAARTPSSMTDVEHALYEDRSIVRNLAMRRTVFGFPRDLLPAAYGSAGARVAGIQYRRLLAEAAQAGVADPEAWAVTQTDALLALLAERGPMPLAAVRRELPELGRTVTRSAGKSYEAQTSLARALLVVLDARGVLTRGRNTAGWKTSRPAWVPVGDWVGAPVEPLAEQEGYAELVSRWLLRFGPGTEDDVVWWLGATKAAVRRALADVGAVAVALEDGTPAWLHPDDTDEVDAPEAWAALLPSLDPTTMGWKGRGFYLGEHAEHIFDRNGNGGPTAWWNGRIVGGWTQDDDGRVVVVPVDGWPRGAKRVLEDRAEELTAWLGGDVVRSIYQSPLIRSYAAGGSPT